MTKRVCDDGLDLAHSGALRSSVRYAQGDAPHRYLNLLVLILAFVRAWGRPAAWLALLLWKQGRTQLLHSPCCHLLLSRVLCRQKNAKKKKCMLRKSEDFERRPLVPHTRTSFRRISQVTRAPVCRFGWGEYLASVRVNWSSWVDELVVPVLRGSERRAAHQ